MLYKTLSIKNHAFQVFGSLKKQREHKLYCDVVLIAEDKHIPAHRNVLAACSEYFRKIFKSHAYGSNSPNVPLEDLSAESVEHILDFIYSGEIDVSQNNLCGILKAGNVLMLTEMLDVICSYLMDSLNVDTCLYLREVAKLFHLIPLKKAANKCFFDYFEEISLQDRFCDLEKEDIIEVMSSDDLKVHSENIVFSALMRWVDKDIAQRKSAFPTLFRCVRLQHVSQRFLANQVRNAPLVRQFHECRDLVDDAFHFHIDPTLFEAQKSRYCRVIFSLNQHGDVHELDFSATGLKTKQVFSPDVQLQSTHVIAKWNWIIYLCGSCSGNSTSVISFDAKTFKLEGNMYSPKLADATAFVMNDHLYVVGCAGKSVVDVYQFRPTFDLVKSLEDEADLPRNASSVVYKDHAYILGGVEAAEKRDSMRSQRRSSRRHSSHPDVVSSVRVFYPATEEWSHKSDLNEARERCGTAVLGSKIFACGGFDGDGACIDSMEYMNVAQESWILITSYCPNELGPLSIVTAEEELYILGTSCNVFWKYDLETEAWIHDERYANRPVGCRIFSLA